MQCRDEVTLPHNLPDVIPVTRNHFYKYAAAGNRKGEGPQPTLALIRQFNEEKSEDEGYIQE